jgi:hypothetical protein
VASRAVDDRVVGKILAIMNHDGPEVDKDEEDNVGMLLQGEHEDEQVVGRRLSEAIQRVEGVASKGSRHDPFVVSLVEVLVDARVVKASVNPVDAEVGEDEEQRVLENVVPEARAILGGVVKLAVAANLEEEDASRDEGNGRQSVQSRLNLKPDLVLDELGVVQGALVEDEEVGEATEQEVGEIGKEAVTGRSVNVNLRALEEINQVKVKMVMSWRIV